MKTEENVVDVVKPALSSLLPPYTFEAVVRV